MCQTPSALIFCHFIQVNEGSYIHKAYNYETDHLVNEPGNPKITIFCISKLIFGVLFLWHDADEFSEISPINQANTKFLLYTVYALSPPLYYILIIQFTYISQRRNRQAI